MSGSHLCLRRFTSDGRAFSVLRSCNYDAVLYPPDRDLILRSESLRPGSRMEHATVTDLDDDSLHMTLHSVGRLQGAADNEWVLIVPGANLYLTKPEFRSLCAAIRAHEIHRPFHPDKICNCDEATVAEITDVRLDAPPMRRREAV